MFFTFTVGTMEAVGVTGIGLNTMVGCGAGVDVGICAHAYNAIINAATQNVLQFIFSL